jgi:hypothetical protein
MCFFRLLIHPPFLSVFALVPVRSLNQTYPWGASSGDTYGNGMCLFIKIILFPSHCQIMTPAAGGSFDSGVGTNSTDEDSFPYNVVRPRRTGILYLA